MSSNIICIVPNKNRKRENEMTNEIELITNPKVRAEHINRVGLLNEVGELKFLTDSKFTTLKHIAEFYGVSKEKINTVVALNRYEIFEAGVRQMRHNDLKQAFSKRLSLTYRGWHDFRTYHGISTSLANLYPKESVLLVGFILEESTVADKLREMVAKHNDIFETPYVEKPLEPVEKPKSELVVITTPQKQHNDMQVPVVKQKQDEPLVINSRDVAEMVGKRHDHVIRDITTIIGHLDNEPKFGVVDYFMESTYQDSKGETRKCYLLTKKGCELFGTRMTGAKGTQFAVTYIEKFNEMEKQLKSTPVSSTPSYMIEDEIQRATVWIEERKEKLLLEETVETQIKIIEVKDEIIEKQEVEIQQSKEVIQKFKEAVEQNVNKGFEVAYVQSGGLSPDEMVNSIKLWVRESGFNYQSNWNKLYKCYNAKYGVNLIAKRNEYMVKNNISAMTTIEYAKEDIIMISNLYDLAKEVFGKKGKSWSMATI